MNGRSIKKDFDRHGHVVLRSFLNEEELAHVIGNVNRYIDQIVPDIPNDRPRAALGFVYLSANAKEDRVGVEAYRKKPTGDLARDGKT